MNYTYNLLNPLDYIRLLFLALFDWETFPGPTDSRERALLIAQGALLVAAVNAGVGLWVASRGGEWQLVLLTMATGVGIGVGIGLASGSDSGVWLGAAFSVSYAASVAAALAVAFTIGGFAALSMAMAVAFVMAVGGALTTGGGVTFTLAFNVVGGLASGVTFAGAVTVAGALGGAWAWLAGMGIALLGGFVVFWSAAILAYVTEAALEAIVKPRSIKADWWSGLILAGLLSLGAAYLFALLARWLPTLAGLHPLWFAALLFVLSIRLPLWPIEAVVGLLGCATSFRSRREPWQVREAIRRWYFDRHTILPLPGEAWAFRHLASLDWEEGTQAAVNTAGPSSHLLPSIGVLRTFARSDPYGVLARIAEIDHTETRQRLSRYTFHSQPESVARARSAYEALLSAGERLAAGQEGGRQPRSLLARVGSLLDRTAREEETLTIQEVTSELGRAVQEMQLAGQLAGPDGIRWADEMLALYGQIETAMAWTHISAIAAFHAPSLLSAEAPQLFPPTLIQLLQRMDELARNTEAYNQATSQVTRQRALLAANEQVVALDPQVENVPAPAGPLLALVIAHWQRLLAAGGGALARAETAGPVANPYVLNNPVHGDLFVGRADILRRLEELWAGEGQKPSVVLYGHRRMGKSSILANLGARFGPSTVIVDFNMQRVGLVASTGELLYNLALALYDEVATLGGWSEPDEERFTAHKPYTAFDRFLKHLDRLRGQRRFIVTVDEFELIENAIDKGQLEPGLLGFWRGIIGTYPWFVMAFAGLHTLQEMTEDYWDPFFGSVTAVPVSFLSREAAWRLITQPTPEFPLDYDATAVEQIIALTHGQPYLVQLIGHGLVTRFNRQAFEEGAEPERRFTVADVQAIIDAPEFFRDGDAYFTGIWRQAEKSKPPEQTAVLRALATSETGIPTVELAQQSGLEMGTVEGSLSTLARHDVVAEKAGIWQFTVELMRRWVAAHHPVAQ